MVEVNSCTFCTWEKQNCSPISPVIAVCTPAMSLYTCRIASKSSFDNHGALWECLADLPAFPLSVFFPNPNLCVQPELIYMLVTVSWWQEEQCCSKVKPMHDSCNETNEKVLTSGLPRFKWYARNPLIKASLELNETYREWHGRKAFYYLPLTARMHQTSFNFLAICIRCNRLPQLKATCKPHYNVF